MERDNKFKRIGRLLSVVCLFVVIALTAVACSGGKTNPYLKSADVQITLNEDGSIDVVETDIVHFGGRSDPWWNYYKDVSKYNNSVLSKISNVKVALDGKELITYTDGKDPDDFTSADKRNYADTGYVYERNKYYEVGVYMSEFDKGDRTITLSYTLSNVMINYADCAGFYYQFVSKTNEMSYDKFTATVRFAAASRDDVHLWTHIDDGGAEGTMPAGDIVTEVNYYAENLSKGVYLETRILLPQQNYNGIEVNNSMTRASIIAEEDAWLKKFQKEVKRLQILGKVDIALTIVVAIVGALSIVLLIRKRRPLELIDKPVYEREIPEGWTAGEFAHVYQYYGKYNVGDAMSATILELFRRRFISIDVGDKKKEAKITVIPRNTDTLAPHEKTVYDMLNSVSNGRPFEMKELEKCAKKDYKTYGKIIEKFKEQSKAKSIKMNFYPNSKEDKYGNTIACVGFAAIVLAGLAFLAWFVFTAFLPHFPIVIAPLVLIFIAAKVVLKKQREPLKEPSQRLYDDFRALGKFMTEFSNMDRHELPALVLWEEYMVYATAMGIADKVSEQLEIAYPQYKQMVTENGGNFDSTDAFLILYLTSPRFRVNTGLAFNASITNISNTISAMQRNAKMMSAAKTIGSIAGGGKGGGGFRGGGGGFGGGGSHAR